MPTSTLPKSQKKSVLPTRTPASEIKKLGWRGVMRSMNANGKMVITNHNEPEAVIMPIAEYETMMQIVRLAEAQTESTLDTLRKRFDQRLANLQSPDAGERMRSVMRSPAKLRGKVKAGTGH
jgi:prevent-host-death family protein